MKPCELGLLLSLLLCSCATENPVDPPLPATVTMNPDAGRGDLLMVMIRLPDGEKLPFAVDTGSPVTASDKSLEPKFGKRLFTVPMINFGVVQDAGVYAAPRLCLDNVPLQMDGTNVGSFDRQKLADPNGPEFMGILGMDVLKYYCVQLDFAAGKLRFLNDEHADKKNWGTPFPLTDVGDGCFTINNNLAGTKGLGSLIDTGCNASGWLVPALYRHWTNQNSSADEKVYSPDGILDGETYHDLDLRLVDAKSLTNNDGHIIFNGIGLRTLAENAVTFDFPKRTMYLKHTSDFQLGSRELVAEMKPAQKSSLKSLEQLKKRGQLPGVAKDGHGKATVFHFNHTPAPYLDTATWETLMNGDSSIHHFTLTRATKNGPWKLKKAWRTDQHGRTIEDYPLP